MRELAREPTPVATAGRRASVVTRRHNRSDGCVGRRDYCISCIAETEYDDLPVVVLTSEAYGMGAPFIGLACDRWIDEHLVFRNLLESVIRC